MTVQPFKIDDPVGQAKEIRERLAQPGNIKDLERRIQGIIDEVRVGGDEAVKALTMRFDGVDLAGRGLSVSREEVEAAYWKVSNDQVEALKTLGGRVERVEKRVFEGLEYAFHDREYDVSIRGVVRPISSVGCYAPGGLAAYPSSLIMAVTPAKVTGVPRVVVCTPPGKNGEVNPLVLVAADLAGVDEIFRVGGAQAIAALAYGTESINPVKKIVGPGNIYVTLAKTLVSKHVSTDFPAGPTELVVLADEEADSWIIALDLIAQAEHDPMSSVGLITESESLAREVAERLGEVMRDASRKDVVSQAISRNAFIGVCKSLRECIEFINAFAPEHLEVLAEGQEEVVEKIQNAGLITVGEYSSVSLSDYCLGTNHVLPTSGYAGTYSGLSVRDFVKVIQVATAKRSTVERCLDWVSILAEAEGLPNHLTALEGRLRR
ncbi:MAG: histidinol dehydrogenase [Candidatus Geothermarchaeales archaeon]